MVAHAGAGKVVVVGALAAIGGWFLFGRSASAATVPPGPAPDPGPDPGPVVTTSACLTSDVAALTTVAWVQAALTKIGISAGGVDGKCGPNTHAAISSFQGSQSLSQTGVVDMTTYTLLKSKAGTVTVPVDTSADEFEAGKAAGSKDAVITIANGSSKPDETNYVSSQTAAWKQGYRSGMTTTLNANGYGINEDGDVLYGYSGDSSSADWIGDSL